MRTQQMRNPLLTYNTLILMQERERRKPFPVGEGYVALMLEEAVWGILRGRNDCKGVAVLHARARVKKAAKVIKGRTPPRACANQVLRSWLEYISIVGVNCSVAPLF